MFLRSAFLFTCDSTLEQNVEVACYSSPTLSVCGVCVCVQAHCLLFKMHFSGLCGRSEAQLQPSRIFKKRPLTAPTSSHLCMKHAPFQEYIIVNPSAYEHTITYNGNNFSFL